MSTVICPKCKGMRRILGMGMIERDCDKCGAKGRITADTAPAINNDAPKLRDDLRSLSDAYTESQAQLEKLTAELTALKAQKENPQKKNKATRK
jgi:ribosomal protein L29